MVLKLGHFGKYITNSWKVLKCDAREGWRRSVGHRVKEERNILHTIKKQRG
jgi:hypothetical protein